MPGRAADVPAHPFRWSKRSLDKVLAKVDAQTAIAAWRFWCPSPSLKKARNAVGLGLGLGGAVPSRVAE